MNTNEPPIDGDGGDEERRRIRREKDAAAKRRRRADRRAAREAAWNRAQSDASDGVGVGNVAALRVPASILLETHIARTATLLDALVNDGTVSISEKTRLFISAIPALARALEVGEFRSMLASLEHRVAITEKRGALRSV